MGSGLKLGEAVENLGGTLLEMVEIDEVDFIVESVYSELLEEGYDEDDIEEAIEYALTEATVTYGHDTDKPYQHKKKSGAGQLVKAVGRLARQKLSSKVRGAKTAASAAVAKGARKVAKGALGVARKMEGDKKPSKVHSKSGVRSASTYSGAGAGTKERVSSGSYTPPTQKKASEKPADPWKGSATVPSKPKPKPKAEKPADPWEGSATTPAKPKPKATTKKAAAPKAKAPAAPKRKKKSSKLDDLLASVRNEEVQIDEKTLTKMEMKKREEIVKSMKDKASDFEKRYPGRGKEVMYATATKMAKKMVEQTLPTEEPVVDKKKEMLDKQRLANQKMLMQKERQLQNQKMQMKKRGVLPVETN
jgi:histone H1/5